MKVKAILSFSGFATMSKGEIKEVSPSPAWDDLIRVGYVRVIPETEEKPEEKPTGKETAKNGNRKSKGSVQHKKRVNG